jgi:hypothetical protein
LALTLQPSSSAARRLASSMCASQCATLTPSKYHCLCTEAHSLHHTSSCVWRSSAAICRVSHPAGELQCCMVRCFTDCVSGVAQHAHQLSKLTLCFSCVMQ